MMPYRSGAAEFAAGGTISGRGGDVGGMGNNVGGTKNAATSAFAKEEWQTLGAAAGGRVGKRLILFRMMMKMFIVNCTTLKCACIE